MAAATPPYSPEASFSRDLPFDSSTRFDLPFGPRDRELESWLGDRIGEETLKRAIELLSSDWKNSDRIEFQTMLEVWRLQTLVAESATLTFKLEMDLIEHLFSQSVLGNLPELLAEGARKLGAGFLPTVPYLDVCKVMESISTFEQRSGFGTGRSPLASALESLLWCLKSIADLKQEKILAFHTHAKRELASATLQLLFAQEVSQSHLQMKETIINTQRGLIFNSSATLAKFSENSKNMRVLLVERSKAYFEIAEIICLLHELKTQSTSPSRPIRELPVNPAPSTSSAPPSASPCSPTGSTKGDQKPTGSNPGSPTQLTSQLPPSTSWSSQPHTPSQQPSLVSPSNSNSVFSIEKLSGSAGVQADREPSTQEINHNVFHIKHQQRLGMNSIRAQNERRRRGLI